MKFAQRKLKTLGPEPVMCHRFRKIHTSTGCNNSAHQHHNYQSGKRQSPTGTKRRSCGKNPDSILPSNASAWSDAGSYRLKQQPSGRAREQCHDALHDTDKSDQQVLRCRYPDSLAIVRNGSGRLWFSSARSVLLSWGSSDLRRNSGLSLFTFFCICLRTKKHKNNISNSNQKCTAAVNTGASYLQLQLYHSAIHRVEHD